MPQRDYLIRMIEQMGAVLARIRKLLLERDPSAPAELKETARRQGVDVDLAARVDDATLLLLLSPSGEPEPVRCWVMAELLYLDGLSCELNGLADEAATRYWKALLLYRTLHPDVIGGIPEAAARVTELEGRLADMEPAGP